METSLKKITASLASVYRIPAVTKIVTEAQKASSATISFSGILIAGESGPAKVFHQTIPGCLKNCYFLDV